MSSEHKGELDIDSIIGAPLIAASKANSLMQSEQVRFLLDTCFRPDEFNDKALHPVMVKMILTSSSIDYYQSLEDGISVATNKIEFQVPLISLIPINTLAVNSVDLDFDMEITSMSHMSSLSSNDGSGTNAILKGKIAKSCQSKGAVSNEIQDSRNLNVKISANSLPLPKGVIELIDMYTRSIQPVQSGMEKKEQ